MTIYISDCPDQMLEYVTVGISRSEVFFLDGVYFVWPTVYSCVRASDVHKSYQVYQGGAWGPRYG